MVSTNVIKARGLLNQMLGQASKRLRPTRIGNVVAFQLESRFRGGVRPDGEAFIPAVNTQPHDRVSAERITEEQARRIAARRQAMVPHVEALAAAIGGRAPIKSRARRKMLRRGVMRRRIVGLVGS